MFTIKKIVRLKSIKLKRKKKKKKKKQVMAIQVFPQKLQNLWEEWNLRVVVLISLSFQIILIFFASERKRTGSMLIRAVIWSSYLLADWFAAVAVGLISSNQGDKCENGAVDNELTAFWAPFLLLHLGGPDTITAFSLEDNELWLRHMIGVVVQVLAVVYVFVLSLPNRFWLPTALILFAGTVKYAERTRALYLACLGNLKESLLKSMPMPDPKDYDEYMEEYFPNQAAAGHHDDQLPTEEATTNSTAGPSSSNDIVEKGRKDVEEYEIIESAYRLYSAFRGLIAEGVFNTHERIQSRKFFKGLNNAGDAFNIVEVELNFFYDALYTKMAALHYGFFWYVLRFVCTALLVAAFLLFAASDDNKSKIHRRDIAITYVLLVGAVILELLSLGKLIFSGWTVALLLSHPNNKASSICSSRIQPLLEVLNVKACALAIIPGMVLFRKRWSGCLYQHSMINYCLQKRYELVEKTAERFQLKEILDEFRYRTEQKVDAGLREFIFKEVKAKATISSNAQQPTSGSLTFSAKGEYVLVSYGCPSSIQQTLSDIYSYDQSVLIWHIATDICFYGVPYDISSSSSSSTRSTDQNRTRCKHLSDYLVYLLIMQPEIMSSVQGLADSRFHVTNEKARKFLDRSSHDDWLELTIADACEKLLGADPETIEMGEVSVSLLSPAVRLAKNLKNMLDENCERTWEMMSKAWLEMLLFGSMASTGPACAQRLNQGGELIILVWLMIANFGFATYGSSHVRYF